MKTKKLWMMLAIALVSLCTISCGGDDDDYDGGSAIAEYVGTWSCTYPDDFRSSTIVTEGTTLVITSSGNMTWTMSEERNYNATMRALGDGWVKISYNGKTYTAEMYVSGNSLTINVNGDVNLTVKDFPFDGTYTRVK